MRPDLANRRNRLSWFCLIAGELVFGKDKPFALVLLPHQLGRRRHIAIMQFKQLVSEHPFNVNGALPRPPAAKVARALPVTEEVIEQRAVKGTGWRVACFIRRGKR